MAVSSDSCKSVSTNSLGNIYECDEPQGLGSEVEYVHGETKWVRYPSMPAATLADMAGDACNLIGDLGTRTLWACRGERPANGINCEEQFIDGEMVWMCTI